MIDLKSDLVNMPTDEMWATMRATEPGWVASRQDPTVLRLERMAADLMGQEAAIFVMSGTVANLGALMTYAERGHQVVLEEYSHVVWGEEWSLAYVCGLYPRLVKGDKGKLAPQDVEAAITESRFSHRPHTDLLFLENPHNMAGGTMLSVAETEALCQVAHHHGASVFIDGSRILYAAAAQGVPPAALVADADGVMFSLTKGLSAPVGALLCGSEEAMARAEKNLRRIGEFRVHKAGFFAAAGIVALESMVDRMQEDVRQARRFAEAINSIDGLVVDLESVQTNIVMVDISATGLESRSFIERLLARNVRAHPYTSELVRFTFHRHVGDVEAELTIDAVRAVVQEVR